MGRKYGKPCFASFMGDSLVMEAKKCLEGHCIPNFEEPGKAVVAMDAMVAHRQWRDEPLEEGSFLGSVDKLMAEEVLTRIRQTGEHATGGFEARGILQAYGIPMPKSELAETAIEAQDAASKIGYPAVLKIASPQILHKSTIGGVALNLKTPEQVGDAFELMMHRAAQKRPDASIRGCQVLPMIKGGREVIIGISLDEQFNHLVMFGLGGTMVEGMTDVTFRIAPINRKDCADMISEIRGTNFLQREPGIDVDAIVDVLLRVSKLALDFPEIQELDINPLVVYPPSQGALSLDMRISLI